jgi:hypothetical protein
MGPELPPNLISNDVKASQITEDNLFNSQKEQ